MLNAISSKPGESPFVGGDARLALERFTWSGGDVLDEVDLALDQRLDRRVLALVDAEDDLVDVRGAAPVVGVGLEPVRRPAGLPSTSRNGPEPTTGLPSSGSAV